MDLLDVLDGVSWLNIKGDGLTSEGLNEDLHNVVIVCKKFFIISDLN